VHQTPYRMVTLAMREPVGVIGVICPDEYPLLGFVSAVAPALCLGNAVIAVPSETAPLLATDFYQIADTSDLPAGALNIITGLRSELVDTIAAHDDVEGVWYFADDGGGSLVERHAAANMKRTWFRDRATGLEPRQSAGEEFLRHATEIKNIWVPYGE
jgi:aldehyde dehydrogenase (NAD+)